MHLRGACCLFRVTSSCFHPSLSCLPEGEALRPARSQPRQPARTRGSAARLPPTLPPSAPTPPQSVSHTRAGGRRCGPRCRTVAVHCGGRGNRCRRSRCDRSVASAAAARTGKAGPTQLCAAWRVLCPGMVQDHAERDEVLHDVLVPHGAALRVRRPQPAAALSQRRPHPPQHGGPPAAPLPGRWPLLLQL